MVIRIYPYQYTDQQLKEAAVNALRVNGMAKEARQLETLLSTLNDRDQILAAIRNSKVFVW